MQQLDCLSRDAFDGNVSLQKKKRRKACVKVGIKKKRMKRGTRGKRRERERREEEGERKQWWREAFRERELLELLIIRVAWRGGDIYARKRPRYISST